MGEEIIKSYKGMDRNMKCRDFQYEIGKTYETENADACACGFHACESPLDVLNYYPPCDGNRYFAVEQSGTLSRIGDDSKVASTKLKIGAEIGIPGLAKAHVEWVKEHLGKDSVKTNTGYQSAATNTGDFSAATNTGDKSAAEVSGKSSVAVAIGGGSKARANIGSAICLVERGDWDGETYPIVNVKAVKIDGKKYKPEIWYQLKNGEIVEVE